MRSVPLRLAFGLCLLAVVLGLYAVVNTMVSEKYTPEMAGWEAQVRWLWAGVGAAVLGATASGAALARRRREAGR